jgi:hypothetical protein
MFQVIKLKTTAKKGFLLQRHRDSKFNTKFKKRKSLVCDSSCQNLFAVNQYLSGH